MMADDAVFAGPKKKTNWLLIGGIGVGGLALITLLLKMNSGGGGTTAAGASINAGLGSLQEEQMNLLGTVQAGALQNTANFAAVGQGLTAGFGNVLSNATQNQNQIMSELGVLQTGEQSIVDTIMPMLNQITTLEQQLQTSTGSQAQAIQAQIDTLRGDALNAINSGTAANADAFQRVTALLNGQFGTTNSQLGTILNWTDEIKARLQQGDYSAPFHGPSNQPWTTAA